MQDLTRDPFEPEAQEPRGVATMKRIAWAMGHLSTAQQALLEDFPADDPDVTEAVEDAFDSIRAMVPDGTETFETAMSEEGLTALRQISSVILAMMRVHDTITRGVRVSDREAQSRWRGVEEEFARLSATVRNAGARNADSAAG